MKWGRDYVFRLPQPCSRTQPVIWKTGQIILLTVISSILCCFSILCDAIFCYGSLLNCSLGNCWLVDPIFWILVCGNFHVWSCRRQAEMKCKSSLCCNLYLEWMKWYFSYSDFQWNRFSCDCVHCWWSRMLLWILSYGICHMEPVILLKPI